MLKAIAKSKEKQPIEGLPQCYHLFRNIGKLAILGAPVLFLLTIFSNYNNFTLDTNQGQSRYNNRFLY